jgi:hypothetical protein
LFFCWETASRNHAGKQRLETIDGYIIPLSIQSVLTYMDMSPPTPTELDTYPHVDYTFHDMELTHNYNLYPEYHSDSINAYGELIPYARQHKMHYRTQRLNQPDNEQLSQIEGLSLVCVYNTR